MTLNVPYPQKRITGGGIYGWNGATSADLTYAQNGGWTVGVGLNSTAIYNYTYSGGSLTSFYNTNIAPLEARGIYWLAEMESFWNDSRFANMNTPNNMPPFQTAWYTATPRCWDDIYGPFLDWIHNNCNTYFAGVHMEANNWNMWQYLVDKCAGWAPVCVKTGGYGYRPDSDGTLQGTDANGNLVMHTLDQLVALVSEFEFECYTPYMFQHGMLPLMAEVVGNTKYPCKKGINMDVVGYPGFNYWVASGVTINGSRPLAEQLACLQKFNYVRDLYGSFDWFNYNFTVQPDSWHTYTDWGANVGVEHPVTSQSLSVNL